MIFRFTLVLALAAPSAAQPAADFWPLVPGNSWTFVRYEGTYNASTGSSNVPVVGSETWAVTDSVTVGAERLPRLDMGADESCLVRFQPATSGAPARYEMLGTSGDPWCPHQDFGHAWLEQIETLEVVVGGEALGSRTVGIMGGDWSSAVIEGVGPQSFAVTELIGTGYMRHRSIRIRHAVVGGDTLGQPLASLTAFMPFDEGNVWQFVLAETGSPGLRVVEWTVTAPDTLRLRLVDDGTTVSTVDCPLVRQDGTPSNGWRTLVRLACTTDTGLFPELAPDLPGYWMETYEEDVSFQIGPQTVVANVASESEVRGGMTTGFVWGASWQAAEGIGVVLYDVTLPSSSPPGRVTHTAQLAYARVGGVAYGAAIIADDRAPSAATLALGVAPNPTAGTAALRLTLARAARTGVQVVDALGRSVATMDLGVRPAGVSTAMLDVRGLAPGVYTVRLDAEGTVATIRLSVVR